MVVSSCIWLPRVVSGWLLQGGAFTEQQLFHLTTTHTEEAKTRVCCALKLARTLAGEKCVASVWRGANLLFDVSFRVFFFFFFLLFDLFLLSVFFLFTFSSSSFVSFLFRIFVSSSVFVSLSLFPFPSPAERSYWVRQRDRGKKVVGAHNSCINMPSFCASTPFRRVYVCNTEYAVFFIGGTHAPCNEKARRTQTRNFLRQRTFRG